MLLQFTIKNVLSFRDETVLSLLAVPGVEHAPGHVVEVPGIGPVLRIAAVYGANASGKSNLVKALQKAAWLVLLGTFPGRPIEVVPFKLDPESRREPCRFEYEIWSDGIRWSYGFACTQSRVEAEWLYRDDGSGEHNVFERSASDGADVSVEIGDALALDDERRQFWGFVAEGTRPAQLFLTEARLRNLKELASPIEFFEGLFGVTLRTPVMLAKYDYMIPFATELLRGAGTGVKSLEVFDPSKKTRAPGEPKSGLTTAAMADQPNPKLRFLHSNGGSDAEVFLEEDEESDGTRRLVDLAPNWFRLERTNTTLVIDELDRSLHTLLSRNLLKRFLAAAPLSSGQLIFTTHDTNLLDLELLPQDSIHFVEKARDGSTRLYSLAEFKPEQLKQIGNEIENGYLRGRFGGTPFLSNPKTSSPMDSGDPKKNAS